MYLLVKLAGISKHTVKASLHIQSEDSTAECANIANYFGEIVEWAGWAMLTWSLSGLVFLWWTVANLVPRANAIWHRYKKEFGDEVGNRKRVFPFLY